MKRKYTDSIDYLLGGSLTLRNGRIDQYQFEEGYCQAEVYSSTIDKFTFCYYDQDHLSNIRQVTKADGSTKGKVIQKVSYYPFGLQLCDGTTDSNVQSHRYNGKELDKMRALNTYDYGARQYNPVTARWDRIDPLAEKYYSISPYAYCAGNPVKYVDPDGREIRYAKNVTKEFKEAFAKACAFMNRQGTKKWLDAIEKRPEIVLIGPPSGTESSSSKKRIHKRNGKVIKASDFMILWNPNQALETNNNVILSPETILAHEAAHMLQTITDLQGQIKDENTKDGAGEYDNMEEKRVITTVEQEAALAHGDIKQGEVTRTDHRGTVVSNFPLSVNEPLPSIKEEKQE